MSAFICNSFQVPNALIDCALAQMSDAALRVYLIIVRKTRGWQKESDRISLSQFQSIGNRSRHTVISGLAELEALCLIEKTQTDKGNEWSLTNGDASANSALVQNLHLSSAKSAPVASAKSAHTKDTIKTTNKIHKPLDEKPVQDVPVQEQPVEEVKPAKPAKSPRKAPLVPIPPNFAVSEGVIKWAKGEGFGDLDELNAHLGPYIDTALSKDYRYSNWDAAFKKAIREDWAGVRSPKKKTGQTFGQNTKPYQNQYPDYASARATESPRPEVSNAIAAFAGIDLVAFRKLKAIDQSITQQEVVQQSANAGMDRISWMNSRIKNLSARNANTN